jgi:hypothetical protein
MILPAVCDFLASAQALREKLSLLMIVEHYTALAVVVV